MPAPGSVTSPFGGIRPPPAIEEWQQAEQGEEHAKEDMGSDHLAADREVIRKLEEPQEGKRPTNTVTGGTLGRGTPAGVLREGAATRGKRRLR